MVHGMINASLPRGISTCIQTALSELSFDLAGSVGSRRRSGFSKLAPCYQLSAKDDSRRAFQTPPASPLSSEFYRAIHTTYNAQDTYLNASFEDCSLSRPELLIVHPHDLDVVFNPRIQYGAHATRVTYGRNEHYFCKHTIHGGESSVTREIESPLP